MNPNSLHAHQINLDFETYKNSSEKIISAVKQLGECTMHDVAKFLGVELNRISGRFGTLVKNGKLTVASTVKIGRFTYSLYKAV